MEKILANQVAIITGAGRGIGAAAARLFASEGASVAVSDLDGDCCEEAASQIQENGGHAIAVPGDITDPAFPEILVDAAASAFGNLHILVNNAGFTWDGMVHKMTDEQWEAMLDVHTTGPFRLIRAGANYMRGAAKESIQLGESPEPRSIINVSSTSGLHGNVGQANYAAAKMGLIGLTKTVAREWGPFGIRCNAAAFGYIDTRLTRPKEEGESIQMGDEKVMLGIPETQRARLEELIPLGRPGTVEEAAGAILFLASSLSSYVTGHTLEVTGGLGI